MVKTPIAMVPNIKRMFLQGMLLFCLFLLFYKLKTIVILFSLILIGTTSLLYKKFIGEGIGIDLVMFVTVVAGIVFGSLSAIITGIVSVLLGKIITGQITKKPMFVAIKCFAVAVPGFIAGYISRDWITMYGIIATIVQLVIGTSLSTVFGRSFSGLPTYAITSIAFNIVVFRSLGPLAMRVL